MNAPRAQSLADADRDVRQYLIRIAGTLGDVLGDALSGLYLHGSLATGAFHRERSSVDLLALTSRRLTVRERDQVARALVLLSGARPLRRDIDVFVVQERFARSYRHPMPYEVHYKSELLHSIRRREIDYSVDATSLELAARMIETRERGVTLVGPPPPTVFGPIPWYAYMAALEADFSSGREELEKMPADMVLNACRILHASTSSAIVSLNKDEAASWAMSTVPRMYHSVINDALQLYRGNKSSDDIVFPEQAVVAFREYVRERCRPAFSRAHDTGEDED